MEPPPRFSVAALLGGQRDEIEGLNQHLKQHGWALLRDSDEGMALSQTADEEILGFYAESEEVKKTHKRKGGKIGKLHLWRLTTDSIHLSFSSVTAFCTRCSHS